jgi:hypothetical protein
MKKGGDSHLTRNRTLEKERGKAHQTRCTVKYIVQM